MPTPNESTRQSRNDSKRSKSYYLLLVVGFIFVGFGMVGAFVPFIPTTPFLLVAVWCFARSDPRYRQWLFSNRYLGPYIRGYFNGEGLSARQLARTLSLLWFTLALSGFLANRWWLYLALGVIGAGVTVHILSKKRGC